MKVLMVPTWYFNKSDQNAGIFTLEQCLALKQHVDVAIYFPFDRDIQKGISCKEEKGILTFRTKQYVSKIPLLPKLVNLIKISFYFKKIKKEFNPDILHAHVSTQAGFFVRWLSKFYGIPYVITEHAPKELLIFKSIDEMMAKSVFKNSDASIGVSKYLCESLKEVGDLELIYNGVSLDYTPENVDSITSDNINISFVGSFYNKDVKGVKYLLESIKILKEEYPNICVHLIGEGTFRKFYEDEAKRLNIDKHIIFYGYKNKSETLNIVSKCDFLVSASLVETFGLSIAEALALGKPVVITKSGAPEEFVNEMVGITVDKESTEALVNGIKEMIRKYEEFDGEYIKKYSEDKLSMSATTNKYLELYNNVLRRR